MKTPSIAVLGNGKFAKALILGFLKKGTPIESLIVIGREESKDSDLAFFQKLNVKTSREILDAQGVETIVIAVKPEGVGPQMKRLKKLTFEAPYEFDNFEFAVPQKIICLASGTNIDACTKYLGIHPATFIKGTGNINVEHCTGIICLAGIHNGVYRSGPDVMKQAAELFAGMGKVSIESSRDILKSVVTVGAWNAFDTRALALIGEKQTKEKNLSFGEWLLQADETNPLIAKYLQNKAEVFMQEMGYSKDAARKKSLETFQSTLATLLLLPDVDIAKLQTHIDKVATKGGCTEQGINKLDSVETLLSFVDLCTVTKPVYRRTKRFIREAQRSFKK